MAYTTLRTETEDGVRSLVLCRADEYNTITPALDFDGTLTVPVNRRQSVKLLYISGLKTRIGSDFDTVSVVYQFRWGGGF